ncbi:hypothetical protein BDB01DRAFT_803881 [Pilobolus umbonatus]|nr:hypothetical protein BDB01DRAFT_803881 [Pilobolus umbonatus]
MEQLPADLMRLITGYLRNKELHTCLTVCKIWNYMFTPYFYEIVACHDKDKNRRFIESMATNPGCKELGKYIRVLDLFSHDLIFEDYDELAKLYFADVLRCCPNVEFLLLLDSAYVIKAILDQTVPQLQHLKHFTLKESHEMYERYQNSDDELNDIFNQASDDPDEDLDDLFIQAPGDLNAELHDLFNRVPVDPHEELDDLFNQALVDFNEELDDLFNQPPDSTNEDLVDLFNQASNPNEELDDFNGTPDGFSDIPDDFDGIPDDHDDNEYDEPSSEDSYDTYSIKQCYTKYQSSLESVDLAHITEKNQTPDTIISYLASFPNLKRLDLIDFPHSNHSVLDGILTHCPNITRLYHSRSLDVPEDFQISSDRFLLVEKVEHLSTISSVRDIEYIVKRFPRLRKLSISVVECEYIEGMLNLLAKLEYLNGLSITANDPWNLDKLPFEYKREQVYKEGVFKIKSEQQFDNMQYEQTVKDGMKTIKYSGLHSFDSFKRSLKDFGYLLNSLEINFSAIHFTRIALDLEDIILFCPKLSVLKISHCASFLLNGEFAPNTNLTTLELTHCKITQSTFRDIEKGYPKLQKLILTSVTIDEPDMAHIILPRTGLKFLALSQEGGDPRYIAKKGMRGTDSSSWDVDLSNEISVEEGEEILMVVQQPSSGPTHYLYSSTLQHIYMNKSIYPHIDCESLTMVRLGYKMRFDE